MASKVTIQDIADELGLSRNTVSKAINNTGVLSETTKTKILQKAVEMGYKHFAYMNTNTDAPFVKSNREIALLTTSFLKNSHFSSTMLDYFQNEIEKLGYHLTYYILREQDISACKLPHNFNKDATDGIMIVELFDLTYSRMLCKLGIPTLFIDSIANPKENGLESDFLYMDNTTDIFHIMKHLKEKGYTKFGFIGEEFHCQSFYERYKAFRHAIEWLELKFHQEYCILTNRTEQLSYTEYLKKSFFDMKNYPEVFFCANDFVAVDFLQVLKETHYSVPDDFLLCGFDDSPESNIITPPLTTVHIHSQIMGFSAIQLLLSRIKEPSLYYRTIYTETSVKYRASTKDE